jgi:hypothetical protein
VGLLLLNCDCAHQKRMQCTEVSIISRFSGHCNRSANLICIKHINWHLRFKTKRSFHLKSLSFPPKREKLYPKLKEIAVPIILIHLLPPADYLSNRGINDGGKVHQASWHAFVFYWLQETYHTRLSSITWDDICACTLLTDYQKSTYQ